MLPPVTLRPGRFTRASDGVWWFGRTPQGRLLAVADREMAAASYADGRPAGIACRVFVIQPDSRGRWRAWQGQYVVDQWVSGQWGPLPRTGP